MTVLRYSRPGFMCHRGRVLAKLEFATYLPPYLTRWYPFPSGEGGGGHLQRWTCL